MGKFSTMLKGFLKGDTNEKGASGSSFDFQTNGQNIARKLYTHFTSELNWRDNIGSALSGVLSEVMSDVNDIKDLYTDELTVDNNAYIKEVSKEVADDIYESISEAAEAVRKSEFSAPGVFLNLVLTDSYGYSYEFLNIEQTLDDGSEVIIATCPDPYDISDCLLFKKDGKFYFNNALKSVGFYREYSRYSAPVNCTMAIYAIAELYDLSDSISSIDGLCDGIISKFSLDDSDVDGNIYSKLSFILNAKYDVSDIPTTIYDCLLLLNTKAYEDWVLQSTKYGIKNLFVSVLDDYIKTNDLNRIFALACESCMTKKFEISNFLNEVQNSIGERSKLYRETLSGITSSFRLGGIYGVINYIAEIIKNGSQRSVDEDGRMVFTSNSGLVPAEYVAGAIMSSVSAISQVVAMVVAIVQPIIGILISVVGALLSAVPKMIEYDYTQTKCRINTYEDSSCLPIFPHALCRYDLNVIDSDVNWNEIINESIPQLLFEVPGGTLFVGRSDTEGFIRVEFHPGMAVIPANAPGVIPLDKLSFVSISNEDAPTTVQHVVAVQTLEEFYITTSLLEDQWAARQPLDCSFDADGYLNEADSYKLSSIFWKNASLFFAWCYCIQHEYYDNYGYYDIPRLSTFNLYNRIAVDGQEHSGVSYILGSDYIKRGQELQQAYFGSSPVLLSALGWAVIPCMFNCTCSYTSVRNGVVEHWNDIEILNILNSVAGPNAAQWNVIGNWNGVTQLTSLDFVWTGVANADPNDHANYPLVSLKRVVIKYGLEHGLFIGGCERAPFTYQWGIYTPQYNASSFWFWVGLTIAVSVVITAAVVVASVAFVKWRRQKRLENSLKVEECWSEATSSTKKVRDPETGYEYEVPKTEAERAADMQAYSKAAFKANLWQKVVGGSVYDRSNYWNSGVVDSSQTDSEKSNSVLASVIGGGSPCTTDDDYLLSSYSSVNDQDYISTNDLKVLITGREVLNNN